MNEAEFIIKLQERVKEQEKVVKEMPFSNVFTKVSLWLGHNPLRIIIPLAIILTLLFRIFMGTRFTDHVLFVFRWFGL